MSEVEKSIEINKAESLNPKMNVPLGQEKGQPRIITSGHYIQQSKKKDLRMPHMLCTFDAMAEDDAIFTSISMTNKLVKSALARGVWEGTGSRASQIAADFLNYNIHNMSFGTWRQAVNDIVTDIQYGFSLLNIVTELRTYGEYKGTYCLKKLAPRDQKSVYGWLWDENKREVRGFVQKPNIISQRGIAPSNFLIDGLTELAAGSYQDNGYPIIRSNQLLHFTYNSTLNNPQGDSPLFHCYTAWKEKKLIEQYQLVAISKGYGGTAILRVPAKLIEAANSGSNPQAAKEYLALQQDAANYNSGESAFIVLTSDTDELSKKYLYDMEFKGVEGSTSDVDTLAIITAKQKSIYNCFGTSFILLGQDGVGSHSLASTGNSVHGQFVSDNIDEKVAVLESQLAPRLLARNDVNLSWKDMPKFKAADPYEFDFDGAGKFIQRVASVNKMTPKALEYFYKRAGFSLEGVEELDFSSKGQSRAGESKSSGGNGNKTQMNSDTNMENKSLQRVRNLVVDGDRLIDRQTDEVVNFEDLDTEGNYK